MAEPKILTDYTKELMNKGSPIRMMFELGSKLAKEHGRENVYDFSLGNPALEPPPEFTSALERLVTSKKPLIHAYTPNRGLPACIEACARRTSAMHEGVEVPPENVVITNGAAGGICVFLKSVIDHRRGQDEIVVFAPYFCEYAFYAENVGAQFTVLNGVGKNLEPDVEGLRKHISEKTRVVILNSPNNPSGMLIRQQVIDEIGKITLEASKKYGRAVWIISDEPYAKIVYGNPAPKLGNLLKTTTPYTAVVTSFSKDLSIPGERVGYVAINKDAGPEVGALIGAMTVYQRSLGFVNAPAIIQMAVTESIDATVDISWYDERRKALCDGLRDAGLEISYPEGAFYAFPKIPEGVDEAEFVQLLAKKCVLAVPGSAFGMPGYLRFSYAVKSIEMINKAVALIKQVVLDMKAGKK